MAIYGEPTSIYLQKGLEDSIDFAVQKHYDIYTSRSHFINAAVVRELKRIGVLTPEGRQTWQATSNSKSP